VGYSNLQSTIKYAQGKLFLAANIRGRLGTMPVNGSVSAAEPRLDHFSPSEAQSNFEKRRSVNRMQGQRPQARVRKLFSPIGY